MLRENYRHKRLSGFTIMHLFGPKLKVLIFLCAAKKKKIFFSVSGKMLKFHLKQITIFEILFQKKKIHARS